MLILLLCVSVPFQSGSQIPNWEDEFPVQSFSEAEEKTIKTVSEQIKVCGGPCCLTVWIERLEAHCLVTGTEVVFRRINF